MPEYTLRSIPEKKKAWLARYGEEMTLYSSFRPHHYDLQRLIQPRRGRNLRGKGEQESGRRRNGDIIDSTGRVSLRTLRAGLLAGLSSPMREWMRMTSWDSDVASWGPARRWLYRAERLNYKTLEFTKAYSAFGLAYEASAQFGIAAFGQFAGKKRPVFFDPYAVGTFVFQVDEEHELCGFMHETEMTCDQLVSAFGLENCSSPVQEDYKHLRGLTKKHRVLWVIEKNDDRMEGSLKSTNREYRSVRFEMDATDGDENLLEESGFFTFPIRIPRWDVEQPDKWPMACPGMDSLGDIESLQEMHMVKHRQLDYRLTPPMGAPTSLRFSPTSMLPAHITQYDSVQAAGELKPLYQVKDGIDDIRQEIHETQLRIRSAFYADLWTMLADLDMASQTTQKTATEVAMLHEEKVMQLTPVLYSYDHDMLRPTILGNTEQLIRQGQLEPPPDELVQGGLKIEFVSILAQAHNLITAGNMERFNGYIGSVAEVSPEVIDIIDWDEQARTYAELTNQPEATIRKPQAVDEIRKARREQQQQAQMLAMAQQGAETAKTMSETSMGTDSALGALMGGPDAPQLPAQAGA